MGSCTFPAPALLPSRSAPVRGADWHRRLWDASSGQCLKTLDNETNSPVTCALFTPNPFYLMTATASPEMTVRVYNIHTARVVKTLRPEGENGASVSLGLASGGTAMGRQAVICAFTRAPVPMSAGTGGSAAGPADSLSSREAASGEDVDMDGQDSVAPGQSAARLPAPAPGQSQGQTQTPDTWVLAGTDKGGIVIWDLASRRLAQVLEGHMAGIVAVAVHPSGAWVASGSVEPERTIRIWRHVDP